MIELRKLLTRTSLIPSLWAMTALGAAPEANQVPSNHGAEHRLPLTLPPEIWTWSTGYIFFKHEGQFLDTVGATQDLLYHFGTDAVLTEIEIPITPFTLGETDQKTIHLEFDLNGLYGSNTIVDFNGNNIRQSLSVDDRPWMSDLMNNFPGAFRITSID